MRRTGGEHVACCLAWRRAWLPTGYRLCPRCPVRPRAPAHSGRLSRRVRPCRALLRFCNPEVTGSIPVRSIGKGPETAPFLLLAAAYT